MNKQILLFTTIILITIGCSAPNEGDWNADPEIISEREEQRPEHLWHENEVPSYRLPELLQTSDGSIVRSTEEWPQKRMETLELFRNYMYGRRPGSPDQLTFDIVEEDEAAMEGAATLRRINVQSAHQGRSHQFEVILFLPNEVSEPAPVFLLLNNRSKDNTDPTREIKSDFWPAEQVIERGYGIAVLQNEDLAPDNTETHKEGVIQLFEGETDAGERPSDAWEALAAWGWGASRVMDYFETDSRIDESQVAVLGHSRGGKASLWAGAEDERFSIVISNESGSGGAALSRRRFGETVKDVNRFTHWFAENYNTYNDNEGELPFDQHMLISLIAPRAVYVASANGDLWADPKGEFLSLAHASPVYELWGHESIAPADMPALNTPLMVGPRGYHVREGNHNLTAYDWHNFMDFADSLWR
ncbi:MAG: hypothetical protein WD491_10065 [Balneolales bacterium]